METMLNLLLLFSLLWATYLTIYLIRENRNDKLILKDFENDFEHK